MMLKINFIKGNKDIALPNGTKALIKEACRMVLEVEEFNHSAEINISIVNDEIIRTINKDFRNIDKATDVLSFPLGEDGCYDVNPENGCFMLGDVVISAQRALFQANEFGHSIEREIAYLTVHSVLHLLGYDHIDEGEEKRLMRSREELVLKKMGLEIKQEGK